MLRNSIAIEMSPRGRFNISTTNAPSDCCLLCSETSYYLVHFPAFHYSLHIKCTNQITSIANKFDSCDADEKNQNKKFQMKKYTYFIFHLSVLSYYFFLLLMPCIHTWQKQNSQSIGSCLVVSSKSFLP